MSCYTLSNCILINVTSGKRYITELLYVFAQENPFKVAMDRSKRIYDIYYKAAQKSEHIASWLQLMSHQPSNFEVINVDTTSATNDEEIFLLVCSKTKRQNKIFVHSHQNWISFQYHKENIIMYNGIPIEVFDRDEAINELNPSPSTTINANGSTIAVNQSNISGMSNV